MNNALRVIHDQQKPPREQGLLSSDELHIIGRLEDPGNVLVWDRVSELLLAVVSVVSLKGPDDRLEVTGRNADDEEKRHETG